MASLSIAIPAYNEEQRAPALLDELRSNAEAAVADAGMELLEVLVVDDGSTDATPRLLAEAAAGWDRLRPVAGEGNRGKGAAIAEGVRLARGDYVLFADVDLSTPLGELGKLAAAIGAGADVAIGSRDVPGAVVERGPLHRKLLGKGFNRTVRALTGLDVRDTQCGFKLLGADPARELLSGQEFPGFAFDVELLVRAQIAGLRIAEVPVLYIHDPRSSVHVVTAGARMLADVVELSVRQRPRARAAASVRQGAWDAS